MKKNQIKYFVFLFFIVSTIGRSFALNNAPIPLSDLKETLRNVKAGSVILIKDGKYTDVQLNLSSLNKNITIKPQSQGGVEITGNSSLLFINSSKITFEGFLFNKTSSRSAIVISRSSGLKISNNFFNQCGIRPHDPILRIENRSRQNVISKNTFTDSHSISIAIMAIAKRADDSLSKENIIENNLFYNIPSVKSVYPNSNGNGLEAIQIGQGAKGTELWTLNTVISENLFEKIIGDGSEIISVKTSGNKILKNTFLDNKSGITLRVGNNTIVSDNYLANTTKGIRVYGSGHVISNNYILNSDLGIQLPSADYRNGQKMTNTGYYQVKNVKVKNNVILYARTASIIIGGGKRILPPTDVEISGNKLLLSDGSKDFEWDRTDENNIDLENNTILKSDLLGALGSNITNKFVDQTAKSFTGIQQYNSLDIKTGASWLRP